MSNARISLHIGVNKYPPAIGELSCCGADAASVKSALDSRREGFTSTRSILLADGGADDKGAFNPTRANIIAKVRDACNQATHRDVLLIQFSGHGEMGADGHLYLLPSDVVLEEMEETGIRWQWLVEKMEESAAEKKILIIDACHSGAGRDVQTAQMKSAAILGVVEQRSAGIVCISSCSSGELAYELLDLGHSIFSYYLREGISGAADPLQRGVIDVSSLYDFVHERTIQEANRIGVKQRPCLISKVAASLETFIITATPLDRLISNVLVLTIDPLLAHILKVAIARNAAVRQVAWKPNIEEEFSLAEEGFDYTAVYIDIDVQSNWPKNKKFINLVRQKYPTVPFVLAGKRDEFLYALDEVDRDRFEQYFFFDTNTPISKIPATIAETLAQVGWDLTTRYGEQVND